MAEPSYLKSEKSQFPWYLENIDKRLIPETRRLLTDYSHIPEDQQSALVHKIRDQAWSIRPYPCTGLGVWLVPYIYHSPAYGTVLKRVKSGATLMDIGCHLGSDLRRLALDGAPTEKMIGVDIASHWDVGFELFNDREKFHARFIEADMMAADSNPALTALYGTVDVISISAVMHGWQWAQQVEGGKILGRFSSGPGAMIVGHQIGDLDGRDVLFAGSPMFRHDPESWKRLWDQIGQESGTKWQCDARLMDWTDVDWTPEDHTWMDPTCRVLAFELTRLE